MFNRVLTGHEYRSLLVILIVGLVHGLIYIHLMPPWQHYDEPAHFEYAWMIANGETWPEWGTYDWAFRSDLVRSMIDNDFYRGDSMPVPNPDKLVGVIGGLQFPQIGDPPLYYLAASFPLRLLRNADLADQLIAIRYVSLFCLLFTLFAAWQIIRELASRESKLVIFVPLTIALIPGFIDSMTAFNNDAGSVLVVTLFLWAAVRITQRGLTPLNVLAAMLTVVAGVLTSKTAIFVLPIFGFVLLIIALGKLHPKIAWGTTGVIVIGFSTLLVYNAEPAYWYRATSQPLPVRIETDQAVQGAFALGLDTGAISTPDWLPAVSQPVPISDPEAMSGKMMTFGVWMWSEAAGRSFAEFSVQSPAITVISSSGGVARYQQPVILNQVPKFVRFSVPFPTDLDRVLISLDPSPGLKDDPHTIFYDDFVLAAGDYMESGIPVPNMDSGDEMEWNGTRIKNLIRNPSIEENWLALRPEIDNFLSRFMSDQTRPSLILHSLSDLRAHSRYFMGVINNLHQTFWGRLGWGHVPILFSNILFPILAVIVFAGITGFFAGRLRTITVPTSLLIDVSILLIFAATLTRGTNNLFSTNYYYSSARYILPVIVPIVFVITNGLANWERKLCRLSPVVPLVTRFGYWSIFIALGFLAIMGIISFYYP